MSSFEGSAFSENSLPWLKFELATELEMMAEGSSPDEIIHARSYVAKVHASNQKFREQVLSPYLEQFGIEDQDQLPIAVQIELAEKYAEWMKEHPTHE